MPKLLPEQPTALKPCPFCGGEAEIMRSGKNQLTLKCVGVQPSGLRGCGMGYSQKYGIRLTEDDLAAIMIRWWNTRADAAPDTSAEAVAWLRDTHNGDGEECLVPAARGDPGAFPVYLHPSSPPDGLEWRGHYLFFKKREIGKVSFENGLWQSILLDVAIDCSNDAASACAALEYAAKSWLGMG